MKRLLSIIALALCTLPSNAQTQHDRIKARGASTFDQYSNTATIVISGATPSVANGNVFKTNNLSTVTITNFLGGVDSQQITVVCGDTNTTIQNNANISVTGGTNFTCGLNAAISFVFSSAASVWSQVGGSGAGGGSTPGAPANSLQKNSGSGTFVASAESSNGTTFAVGESSQFKGPIPWYDLGANGGSTSTSSTTASCTSVSPNVTLTTAQDFVNGQGIVIYQCGAATTLVTPSTPTVTSTVTGSTSYTYCVIAEDHLGGLTPCGPNGTTTTGPAVLGRPGTSIVLTQVSNSLGVATYTCSGNCNLTVNYPVNITGFGNLDNGVRVVTGTPTSTTFTTYTANVDGTTVATGAAAPFSANILSFPANSYSGNGTLRYWIYRGGTLAGVAVGLDPYYVDYGQGIGNTNPAYVPTSAPVSAQNGYLESSIVSGGGTVNLVLANNAGATTSGQTVLHDNAVPLLNLMQSAFYAFPATIGPSIYIPSGMVFNGTTDMVNGITTGGFVSAKILLGGIITLNQPWVMRSGVRVDGSLAATRNTSFQADSSATINLNSHPGFYISPIGQVGAGGFNYSNIIFNAPNINNPYESIYSDLNSSGNGQNGIILTNINTGVRGISSIILKGAFGNIINSGVMGGDIFVPGIHLTNSSSAVTGTNNSQTPGNMTINGTALSSDGIQVDCLPNPSKCVGGGDLVLQNSLMESQAGPLVGFYATGSAVGGQVTIRNSSVADAVVGQGTPGMDAGFNASLELVYFEGSNLGPTIFLGGAGNLATGAGTSLILNNDVAGSIAAGVPYVLYNPGSASISNQSLLATGTGRFLVPMTTPTAPVSAVVSAGGSIPVGTYFYAITAVDIDGFESFMGAPLNNIVVTTGNQTVTVTRPTLPAGAVSWYIIRGVTGIGQSRVICTAAPASQLTQVDSFAAPCGNSVPNVSFAAASALSSSGIYTNNLRLAANGFTSSFVPSATVNRTYTLPDASGTFCNTAFCTVNSVTIGGDSAISNAPRVLPAIFFPGALTTTWTGSSWTLDKPITITRVQSAVKVVASGCSTAPIVQVTDGTTPINLTVSAVTNDSGAISQNYAAGAVLSVGVQTAASGCTTSPGDASVVIQYRMQ